MFKEDAAEMSIRQCQEEVGNFTAALDHAMDTGMSRIFPKLETLAVDSIYGKEDNSWGLHEASWTGAQDSMPIQQLTTLFSDFLRRSTIKYLCTRDSSGPLCVEHLTFAHAGGPGGYPVNHSRTIHFTRLADQLALPLGGHIKWVSDEPLDADLGPILLGLGRCANHVLRSREAMVDHFRQVRKDTKRDKASVDIYLSTTQYGPFIHDRQLVTYGLDPIKRPITLNFTSKKLSEEVQVAVVRSLERKINKMFEGRSDSTDEFRWHMSQDIEICPACGSGAPTH